MSNVWFTSDLHFEEDNIAKHRNFGDTKEEHDEHIIDNINSFVRKRDKLFILGDVARSIAGLPKLGRLNGVKELIIGNHDNLATERYLEHVIKVHGFRRYKKFWLTHCPVHPQEIYRCRGNIHGHLHNGAATPPLPYPYFNVNLDYNSGYPVSLEIIQEWFDNFESE